MLLRATSSRSPTVHMQIGNEHFLFYGSVIVASALSGGQRFQVQNPGKRATKAITEWLHGISGDPVEEVSRTALESQFKFVMIRQH